MFLNGKVGAVVALALVLFCLDQSVSGDAPAERSASRDLYRTPDAIPFPEDNPYSEAKSKLGEALFFDPILSGSGARSCASCHNPGLSWGDGLPRAIGEKQSAMTLRSPTLLAVAWTERFGWDGKYRDLEAVAFGPITSPANMNMAPETLIERLSHIPGYVDAFTAAFGPHSIDRRNIELALATYQRSIVPGEAAFDRWIKGDEAAIGEAAKRGFTLFNGKGRCAECHSGFAFTDGSFHDIGVGRGDDIGRGRFFPTSEKLRYAFKTPTLRDVARRAPYMHDGSVPTLEAVIDLYNRGGVERPSRSELIAPLGLNKDEKADLVAFLNTLNEPPKPVSMPILPR